MGDLEPITRNEKLWSGEDLTPVTRREMYIKHLYDETQVIPEYPVTREEMFILKAGEELHDVTIEQLTATENKTYSEEGVAYSPVIVNVPQTTLTTLDVTENGTYTAPSGTAYSEVDVDVPLPENAYLLKEIEDVEIATFTDGSDLPMPKLEVAIEPQQEGSGDPSPENIRPIIGWDEVDVTRTGKNLFDSELSQGGIYPDSGNNYSSNIYVRTDFIPLKKGTYTISQNIQNAIRFYDKNKIYNRSKGIGTFRTANTITLEDDSYIKIVFRASDSSDITPSSVSNIQLEIGDDATAYEPYNGQTITLDLDGTRYGGTLDLVSGVMMITHGYATLRDLEWTHASPSGSIAYDYFTTTSLSSIIKPMSGSTEVTTILNSAFPKCTSSQVAKDGYDKYLAQGGYSIFISDSDYTTVNDFLAEFGNQQLVYELATPLTIQLTPTVVKSLKGKNNVFADSGAILDLSYLAKEE